MPTIEAYRLPLFIAGLVIMKFCEIMKPARSSSTSFIKRWGYHLTVSGFNTLLTRLSVAVPLWLWVSTVDSNGWGVLGVLEIDGAANIFLTLIVFDLFNYHWHRANHVWPFLWRFHRYHHVDTELDVTTSLRFHAGELFLSYGVKALWVLVWGPSLEAFLIFETAITAYAMFHHSNIDFNDAVEEKLRWIHMTPRLHAAHHTVSRRTRDANYSTIFLVWDRLFGTLKEADREELKHLGLKEGRKSAMTLGSYWRTPLRLDP